MIVVHLNKKIVLALHSNLKRLSEEILPLSVVLSQSFDGWEIGLRINAHISGSQFKLKCFNEELTASIDPYRDTIDCFNNSEAGQSAIWTTLERASKNEDRTLEAEYISDSDDNSEVSVKTELTSVVCHSLAWTNTQHEQKLVEVLSRLLALFTCSLFMIQFKMSLIAMR